MHDPQACNLDMHAVPDRIHAAAPSPLFDGNPGLACPGQEMVNGKMHTDWQKRGLGSFSRRMLCCCCVFFFSGAVRLAQLARARLRRLGLGGRGSVPRSFKGQLLHPPSEILRGSGNDAAAPHCLGNLLCAWPSRLSNGGCRTRGKLLTRAKPRASRRATRQND